MKSRIELENLDDNVLVILSGGLDSSVATMMLVGSKGDTFIETIFCSITLYVTIGAFAYILGNIGIFLKTY